MMNVFAINSSCLGLPCTTMFDFDLLCLLSADLLSPVCRVPVPTAFCGIFDQGHGRCLRAVRLPERQ